MEQNWEVNRMPRIIKAYRCYICANLFEKHSARGMVIGKRYVTSIHGLDEVDIAFCGDCAEKMMQWVKHMRCGEVGEKE